MQKDSVYDKSILLHLIVWYGFLGCNGYKFCIWRSICLETKGFIKTVDVYTYYFDKRRIQNIKILHMNKQETER